MRSVLCRSQKKRSLCISWPNIRTKKLVHLPYTFKGASVMKALTWLQFFMKSVCVRFCTTPK